MTVDRGLPIILPAASWMVTVIVCCCSRVPPTLRAAPVTVQVSRGARTVGWAMSEGRVARRIGRRRRRLGKESGAMARWGGRSWCSSAGLLHWTWNLIE